ncbi:DnaJ like chaperone protein [Desulfobotulus alkaliphilus]|uniref:DnaJ like chaperone protein n=1 Tax=Desulfobotulus alkaliphilus TaxID=622671 RepID=A0A562RQB3_9BACT|nr:co-chaperone DjlA [Desulfobotulus alkaliphilus]TWI71248.1 DnaJ like chaperone protein [Desulfobotulus alkaliphilus]
MGWIGKLVGGTLGFAIGGPLGAILGAAFGHGFDKRDDAYLAGKGGRPGYGYRRIEASDDTRHMTFFVAAFSMLAKLTKADGRVSEVEIRTIEEIMEKDLRLNADSRKIAIQIFRTAVQSPESFDSFAAQFADAFRNQRQILELMADILMRVAVSDGKLASEEERMIRSAVQIFRLPASFYEQLRSRYMKTGKGAYDVLDLDPSATDDEVKKQYRRLVREYHPDAIASKGLPEEFTELAEEKFRAIQEAYETIKKSRGMS